MQTTNAPRRTSARAACRFLFLLSCAAAVLAAFQPWLSPQTFAQKPVLRPMQKPSAAPTPPPDERQEVGEGDVISFRTSEVLLPVTVRDRDGKLVTTLTRNDFQVFEEGRPQPLSDFAVRDVPVDVVLMVDASSSAEANLEDFRRAAEGFAEKLAAQDRISLIKFDDRVELLQDWTQSRVQLRRSLKRVAPGVFTRFNDALLLAAKDQLKSGRARHAVIVLTDGIDSGRGYATLEDSLRELLRAQAIVYVVSNTEIERQSKLDELNHLQSQTRAVSTFNSLRIDDLRESLRVLDASEQNLQQLATATGGRLYKPKSFEALDETYSEVAEELRHQYTLYYTPLDKARDGHFRRVRVEASDPSLKVASRVGYFAPSK
jgi:Ca-activated chloride channel family protein